MYFTISRITDDDYQAIQNIRPRELPVRWQGIPNDLAIPETARRIRFPVRSWAILMVHEENYGLSPYEFVITMDFQLHSGERVVAQLHFSTRLQAIAIARSNEYANNTIFPCTLLEFPEPIDSNETLPLQYYIAMLASQVLYADTSWMVEVGSRGGSM